MRNWYKKLLIGWIAGCLVLACSDSKNEPEEPVTPRKRKKKSVWRSSMTLRYIPEING